MCFKIETGKDMNTVPLGVPELRGNAITHGPHLNTWYYWCMRACRAQHVRGNLF